MSADRLTNRQLNRATLERQLLLRRHTMPVLSAVEHLVGLQAQVPLDPYSALWSRIEGFAPQDLAQLLLDRAVVRIVVMRGTIHLVTADDCLVLRPLVQPVLDKELARHRDFAPALAGVDLHDVLAFARALFDEGPRTAPQLRAAFADRFPNLDAAALAYACRNHLALVQVPPRGVWGQRAQVTTSTTEAWLGRPVVADPSPDPILLRYFAAFGPASVADVAAWSGLTGLREIVERLRSRLREFRDERGRALFDLPDAPRPDPDTPAPPRFLPEYDNLLLSHADRSRFTAEGSASWTAPVVRGTVLHDGVVAGTWHIDREPDRDVLVVHHRPRLNKRSRDSIASEGRRFIDFHEERRRPRDVRLIASSG